MTTSQYYMTTVGPVTVFHDRDVPGGVTICTNALILEIPLEATLILQPFLPIKLFREAFIPKKDCS